MILLTRTNSQNILFQNLVLQLDNDLKIRDGDEHSFYAQFNKIDTIPYVLLATEQNKAVGCAALKVFDDSTMEIKRMFVTPEMRGKGIATQILIALEKWAKEFGYEKCILETGIKQIEALALYKRNNYKVIENYGQYKNAINSICFEKKLNQ